MDLDQTALIGANWARRAVYFVSTQLDLEVSETIQ